MCHIVLSTILQRHYFTQYKMWFCIGSIASDNYMPNKLLPIQQATHILRPYAIVLQTIASVFDDSQCCIFVRVHSGLRMFTKRPPTFTRRFNVQFKFFSYCTEIFEHVQNCDKKIPGKHLATVWTFVTVNESWRKRNLSNDLLEKHNCLQLSGSRAAIWQRPVTIILSSKREQLNSHSWTSNFSTAMNRIVLDKKNAGKNLLHRRACTPWPQTRIREPYTFILSKCKWWL